MSVVAAALVGCSCFLFVGALSGALGRAAPRRTRRTPAGWRLAHWLQQSGASLSVARFVALSAALAVSCLLVLAAATGSFFVAVVPAAATAFLPRAYLERRRRQRLRAVQRAWPDALRDLLASIGAGRPLGQALHALATAGPDALRRPFGRFHSLARALGTVPALEILKEDLADPTSDRVIEVLVLAYETGGTAVRPVLEDLLAATTKDLKLVDALDTEGLEMRINVRAVVVMPWLVLVALTARPGPFREFYRGAGGLATLLVGASMSAAGMALLSRLARQPEDERVFPSRSPA
jgi:tight adherence protein B